MMHLLRKWLQHKWSDKPIYLQLIRSYAACFASEHGTIVLNHLLDNIYFKVYEGSDPHLTIIHNARRSVVQEILENIDRGEHPDKYIVKSEQESELLNAP